MRTSAMHSAVSTALFPEPFSPTMKLMRGPNSTSRFCGVRGENESTRSRAQSGQGNRKRRVDAGRPLRYWRDRRKSGPCGALGAQYRGARALPRGVKCVHPPSQQHKHYRWALTWWHMKFVTFTFLKVPEPAQAPMTDIAASVCFSSAQDARRCVVARGWRAFLLPPK